MMVALKESLYPSQREMLAEQLGELNWRLQPQVVESLTKAGEKTRPRRCAPPVSAPWRT